MKAGYRKFYKYIGIYGLRIPYAEFLGRGKRSN